MCRGSALIKSSGNETAQNAVPAASASQLAQPRVPTRSGLSLSGIEGADQVGSLAKWDRLLMLAGGIRGGLARLLAGF